MRYGEGLGALVAPLAFAAVCAMVLLGPMVMRWLGQVLR